MHGNEFAVGDRVRILSRKEMMAVRGCTDRELSNSWDVPKDMSAFGGKTAIVNYVSEVCNERGVQISLEDESGRQFPYHWYWYTLEKIDPEPQEDIDLPEWSMLLNGE